MKTGVILYEKLRKWVGLKKITNF